MWGRALIWCFCLKDFSFTPGQRLSNDDQRRIYQNWKMYDPHGRGSCDRAWSCIESNISLNIVTSTPGHGIDCLFVCLWFTSHSKIFHLFVHLETSPLPMKGCKFWHIVGTHKQWGFFLTCHTYCDTSHPFIMGL